LNAAVAENEKIPPIVVRIHSATATTTNNTTHTHKKKRASDPLECWNNGTTLTRTDTSPEIFHSFEDGERKQ
jgi:hypothetical protein